VDGQPENGEDDHDEDQKTSNLTLAVRRTRLFLSHNETTQQSVYNIIATCMGVSRPSSHALYTPLTTRHGYRCSDESISGARFTKILKIFLNLS